MCKITTLNKRVRCSKNERPFHAFRSKSSLKRWLRRNVDTTLSDMRIFRVQFSGEMKRGTWDGDWSIKTITGEYCTVLENVTTEFIPTRNRK
ncbi:MAG: hypothetical protein NTZ48_05575 [Candidatus Omnitrophica bacterium]|nr:hypothetical protein [Candidatus Omnitrophota bacterium]